MIISNLAVHDEIKTISRPVHYSNNRIDSETNQLQPVQLFMNIHYPDPRLFELKSWTIAGTLTSYSHHKILLSLQNYFTSFYTLRHCVTFRKNVWLVMIAKVEELILFAWSKKVMIQSHVSIRMPCTDILLYANVSQTKSSYDS